MFRAWLVCISVAALCAGCGDDDDGLECGAGTVEVGGECVPDGPDGGFDDDGCGAGTRPDGAGGCIASALPSDQRSCIGRFGPIAEDAANTLYVDGSYTGGGSDGSAAAPYTAIQVAVDAASDGDTVAIASGTYDEDVDMDAPLALEGRCAREVTIDGTVSVTSGGTFIRGVTVTNGSPGIQLAGAIPLGGASFGTVIGTSIVEMNGFSGIQVEASSLDVDFSEIRLTQAMAGSVDIGQQGSGIYAFDGSFLRVGNSIVEMNGGHGIDFADATGPIETTIDDGDQFLVPSIRSGGIVEMNIVEMNGFSGLRISALTLGLLPAPDSPRVSVLSNQIASNGEHGIAAQDTVLDISGNDIDDNGGSITDGYSVAAAESRVSVTGNRMSGSDGGGVHVIDSQTVVAGNTIGGFPIGGVVVTDAEEGATVANNVITGVGNVGVVVFGVSTDVIIDGNEISGTQVLPGSDLVNSGHGIYITRDALPEGPFFDVRNNYVHDNEGTGITLDQVVPADEGVPLYLVIYNTVERNANMGINIQGSGDGDVWFNEVIDNERFGIRGVDSAIGTARLRVFGNLIEGTAITAAGGDGDGIAMIETHVGVGQSLEGNNVQSAERAGIVFTGMSSGFCDENQVGDIDSNGQYDILIQGDALSGMSAAFNSTGIFGIDSSAVDLEVVDGTFTGHEAVPKPALDGS